VLRSACTFGGIEDAVRVNLTLELRNQSPTRRLRRGRAITDTRPALCCCDTSDQNAIIG
jgi:hypothetical protein